MAERSIEFKSSNDTISKFSLPLLYGVTMVAHIVSAIFALQYNELESQKTETDGNVTNMKIRFALNEVKKDGTIGDMTGVFGNLTGFGMLGTTDIIVASTMAVHLLRYFVAEDFLTYKGWFGMALSFLHISSYSISHFLALLSFYLVAGYRQGLAAIIIFVITVIAEAVQHMAASPQSNLKPASKRLLALFSMAGLITYAILIGMTLTTREENGLQGGVIAFVFLITAEGLKFLNEIYTQSQKGTIKGEASTFSRAVDSRHVHMVLDLCIKCLLVWYIHLTNAINTGDGVLVGGPDNVDYTNADLKDQRGGVVIALLVYAGLFLLYVVGAAMGRLPALQAQQSFEKFPSSTLDERSRMLQVA